MHLLSSREELKVVYKLVKNFFLYVSDNDLATPYPIHVSNKSRPFW